MKSMNSFVRLGANHSHSRSYGEDLQRRMADEGAISCKAVWRNAVLESEARLGQSPRAHVQSEQGTRQRLR